MTSPARHSGWIALSVIAVAFNMRPAFTSVGPVLPLLSDELSLSGGAQSFLTALPVFFLGAAAPMAAWSVRRLRLERIVFGFLAILIIAIAIRPLAGAALLLVGTAVVGACIGVIGVLLPAIIKRDFAKHQSLFTGLYTAVLCVGAATAAGATEPLRRVFDGAWSYALAVWMVPATLAAIIWWRNMIRHHTEFAPLAIHAPLYRDALAWQITGYMGLQSALAYTVFGWLPTILQDRGVDPVAAGVMLSISIIVQVITALAAPWFGGRMRDQRLIIAVVMVATMIGLVGCFYAPVSTIWIWAILVGLGQGGAFSMALTLLSLRTRNHQTAARLSSMAQGIGYLIAATGPFCVGYLHGQTGGWTASVIFLGLIGLTALWAGLGAGRARFVVDGDGREATA